MGAMNNTKYDYLIDRKDMKIKAKKDIVDAVEDLNEKLVNYYGDIVEFNIIASFSQEKEEKEDEDEEKDEDEETVVSPPHGARPKLNGVPILR